MKARKRTLKVEHRGEAILEPCLCQCGCGITDLLDVRHGQKYIRGHGGAALLKRRKQALQAAIEAKLIVLGIGVLTAQRAAAAFVERALQAAKQWAAQFGYDYLTCRWNGGAI